MVGEDDRSGEGSAFASVLAHLTTLMRKEWAFARAEMGENLARAGRGLAMLVIAALLALTALNVIAGALVAAVAAAGLSPVWAGMIVGGGLVLLAIALAMIGARRVDPGRLAPRETAENLRRDAQHIWGAVRD